MSGVTLALISAFFWALNAIIIRLGVRHVDPLEAAYVSTYPSILLLILISLTVGDASAFLAAAKPAGLGLGLAIFAVAGLIGLAIARFFYFLSVLRLGPSRSAVFLSSRVLVAPLLGVLILGEAFTLKIGIGGGVMFIGLILLTTEST